MPEWWARFEVYNLEIREPIEVRAVRVVPAFEPVEQRKITDRLAGLGEDEYLLSAYAIVYLGAGDRPPAALWEEAFGVFWPVHEALSFLQHRDLRVAYCELFDTPGCAGERITWAAHSIMCAVSHGPVIHVRGSYGAAVGALADLWDDDEADGHYGFRYAVTFQHSALQPRTSIEGEFTNQWIALELLANEWSENDRAPACLKPLALRRCIQTKVRRTWERAVAGLVASGSLAEDDAQALVRHGLSLRAQAPAVVRIQAFLKHFGVTDVPLEWIERGCWLRNRILHGRRWMAAFEERWPGAEAAQSLWLTTMQARLLVDRYVMWLAGYEPLSWSHDPPSNQWYTRIVSNPPTP